MAKYTYSRTLNSPDGLETFTAAEFASFDEGKKAVDKGIYDRKLELQKQYPGFGVLVGGATPVAKPAQVYTPRPPQPTTPPAPDALNSGDNGGNAADLHNSTSGAQS